jgi:hypothetical protein
VTVSLDRVGDTLMKLGAPHEALPLYRRSLALRETLLARAPDSGQAQRDVWGALWRVVSVTSGAEQEGLAQRLMATLNDADARGRLHDPFFVDLLKRLRDLKGGDDAPEPA